MMNTTNTATAKTQPTQMTAISLLGGGKRSAWRSIAHVMGMDESDVLAVANRSLDEVRELLVEKFAECCWFPTVVSNRFGTLNIDFINI